MSVAKKKGRRPDPSKDEAIIAAAGALFRQRGYSASIDDIAAAAGVSKQTVYTRYPSKEDLFCDVVRQTANELVGPLLLADADKAPRIVLNEFAARYCELLFDPERVAMMRLMIGQAAQFPDLARRYFESGAFYVRSRLAHYLERQNARGRLSIDDARDAASMFLGLVKGGDHLGLLLGVEPPPLAPAARAARAVDIFMKIYGVGD